MASDYDGTELVVCPFDKAHCVAISRLTYHVNKCRKNHPHVDIKMCPFNARHYIEDHMYQHHLLHCSDRAVIDREIMQSSGLENGSNYTGNVNLPAYDNYSAPEENWDEEPAIASYRWNNDSRYQLSTQVRQPHQEPAVLDSQDQEEINRRLEERRQSRQVNTSNSFLSRPDDVRSGVIGAGTSISRGNSAAHVGGMRHDFAGPVPDSNGASGTNGDTAGTGAVSASGASGGGGAAGRGLFRESQMTGHNGMPVLAGLGRGMAAQGSVAASASPTSFSVGRGQASVPAAQPLKQPRKVTQTPAFTLPGVGRGLAATGRGGAPSSVSRPGQGGR